MGRISLKHVRQKEIISAFYKVAKNEGLENTSIAKVADHMGINPSLILHYFKNRDEIFSGLIHFILEKYSIIYAGDDVHYTSAKEVVALVDNLFSRKWDKLFDDGVFYSCYALTYRDKKIRASFKALHDALRELLVAALKKAKEHDIIHIANEKRTAEIIFALVEGAYYYLGMVDSRQEYNRKIKLLRDHALETLGLQ